METPQPNAERIPTTIEVFFTEIPLPESTVVSDSPESASTPEESPSDTSAEETSSPEESKPSGTTLTSATATTEDLPEEFELTPELVEEEAIRGDFVLRWAAILLGILLGCTVVISTETLVHVKAGEFLSANGFLPDGTDPFSYTTEGRAWRNQAWLFDLVLSGIHSVAGALGLSLFKAILVGLTVWSVVTVSRPNTPTWWSSIVAVLTLIGLSPFLSVTPELLTILGCGLLMRLFSGWRYDEEQKVNLKIVVLFLFWANSDSRMFLGLLLLILLSVGEGLRRKNRDDVPIIQSGALWPTLGAAAVASLINPFGWHAWLYAVDLYTVSDPLIREYYADTTVINRILAYPLWSEIYWESLTIPFVSAIVVGGLGLASLFLNYDKLVWGEFLAMVVFLALGVLTLRDLGPALPILAVLISLNCQDWYRSSFRQEYRVDKWEILLSRGGRAVTVLSFMAVAWLGMTGRLFEGTPRTIGFGFENQLENSLNGLTEDLKDSYDPRPFNFSLQQGDILIWADQQVFIDSRLALFEGSTTDLEIQDSSQIDVNEVHQLTRSALRRAETEEEAIAAREAWRSTFQKYKITHALPRVAGGNPDYVTYNDLLVNPEFRLTTLTPTVAVFYRSNLADDNLLTYVEQDEYETYLDEHLINFLSEAFEEDVTVKQSLTRGVFPQPESAYVSYLTADREQIPAPLILAGHYLQHIEQSVQGRYQIDFRLELAFSYLAIRNANLALAENPDSSQAFAKLGRAYYLLGLMEQRFCNGNGIPYDISARMLQAHQALHQALIGNPNDLNTLNFLRMIAINRNKPEVALQLTQRILDLPSDSKIFEELPEDLRTSLEEFVEKTEPQIAEAYEQIQKQIDTGVDPLRVAASIGTQGFPLKALEMMESENVEIPPNSEPEFLYGIFLLEAGRVEEAYTTLLKLEPLFKQFQLAEGYRYAAIAALGHADYEAAMDFKKTVTLSTQRRTFGQSVFPTIPLTTSADLYMMTRFRSWQQLMGVQDQATMSLWEQAVYELEQGQNGKAEKLLRRALNIAPDSLYRPLIATYLNCLSDELVSPYPPGDEIPITGDLFEDEPEEEKPEEK